MQEIETLTANSLSQQAFRKIEKLIVTMELRPGALVTEKQLIALTGQGRTPVREAVQKLEWQGLIVVRPRAGLQIAEIVAGEHEGIMQVTKQLEPLAAALVAAHANADQRLALVECARAMSAAAATNDLIGFVDAGRVFDEIFEDACPNRFLSAALAPLRTHSRRLWFSTASVDRMDQSVTRHVAVIRAIQGGDQDAARRAMETLLTYLST
ncbi:GntR family transcriptional regulator [Rhizobium deserti]|nr:GntR family transcriptional regulator [Rhizobium deserti]